MRHLTHSSSAGRARVLLLSLLYVASISSSPPPCSLNGVINAQGVCTCWGSWSGEVCDLLQTLPSLPPPQAGYGQSPLVSSWGGNIVYADNLYHLFVAEMENNCTLNEWETNSACIHAISDSPLGPFTKIGVAVPVWCHNPQILTLPNNTGYALFHIGTGVTDPSKIPTCHRNNASAADIIDSSITTSSSSASGSALHFATSLYGPWTPITAPSNCNNPAPMIHPNGTYYVLCGSNTLFSAATITGPWNKVTVMDDHANGPKGGYEDGFIWIDTHHNWHVLYHVWSMFLPAYDCSNTTVSAHGFSLNGIDWFTSNNQPYTSIVHFTDGTTQVTPTRERPKLLFSASGEPTHLINGAVSGLTSCMPHWCSRCKEIANYTYTLIAPLM